MGESSYTPVRDCVGWPVSLPAVLFKVTCTQTVVSIYQIILSCVQKKNQNQEEPWDGFTEKSRVLASFEKSEGLAALDTHFVWLRPVDGGWLFWFNVAPYPSL